MSVFTPLSNPTDPVAGRVVPLERFQRRLAAVEPSPNGASVARGELLLAHEAERLMARCGKDVVRLVGPFGPLVEDLPDLGAVVAHTRNAHAIQEKRGSFRNVKILGATGLVLGGAIDLRLLLDHWHLGFAVTEGERTGLHFFDRAGTPIHRVLLDSSSDRDAFASLVARHRHADQTPRGQLRERVALPVRRADSEVSAEGLRAAWARMQDAHELADILRSFAVTRLQALRLVGEPFAHCVATDSVERVLGRVVAAGTPIMVFVGSAGAVQIHSGCVRRLHRSGRWFGVWDPSYRFLLRSDRIETAWVVRKPTRSGVVTSLEIFDRQGENIALLFGARTPGKGESDAWRALFSSTPSFRAVS